MAFPEDLELCRMLVDLKPFLPKAKDSIEIVVEELEHGSFASWCNIKPLLIELCEYYILAQCAFDSITRKKVEKTFYSILTLFDKHKYSDIAVIADVLEIFCLLYFWFPASHVKEKIMAIRYHDKNIQTNKTVFEMILVCSYKDIPSLLLRKFESGKIITQNRNYVKMLAYYGNVHLLKAAISFGAILIVPQDNETERLRIMNTMWELFDGRTPSENEDYLFVRPRFYRNVSLFDESSRKRLFYVNLVLQILVMSDFHMATDDYIKCIRILTKSTPEPLITYEEIKNYITKLCNGITMNEKVHEFLKNYEIYFPESHEASKPRSLKHLSRFQVRENLRIARSFPHGVESLHVPKKIQNYIQFKDILLS